MLFETTFCLLRYVFVCTYAVCSEAINVFIHSFFVGPIQFTNIFIHRKKGEKGGLGNGKKMGRERVGKKRDSK